MEANGTDTSLGELDLALVSAAIRLSDLYEVPTALARPTNVQSIREACEVIAELGPPPLRVSVARDLAPADFTTDDLRPLLVSILEAGIEATDDALEARRGELREVGPTVTWPGFPPPRPE
jgi:hypothetical protein